MMHNSTFEFTGYAISFNLNAEGTKVKKKKTPQIASISIGKTQGHLFKISS